jgi:hypothetical protein
MGPVGGREEACGEEVDKQRPDAAAIPPHVHVRPRGTGPSPSSCRCCLSPTHSKDDWGTEAEE